MNRERVRLRYAEPQRRYHTTEHLDEVLAHVATLSDLASDVGAVELAALFHDAVYDPTDPPGASEAASAALAREELGGDPRVDEVARLVLLTAGHDVDAGDTNGAVLVDADLAILGAPAERYGRYARDVRAEYAHVDDAAWRAGRSAVLERFLARPRLYATDRFHELLDGAARRNLAQEVAALRGGQPLP